MQLQQNKTKQKKIKFSKVIQDNKNIEKQQFRNNFVC